MAAITLPAPLAARLEKLASEAGRTPEEMLSVVMEDGFEVAEKHLSWVLTPGYSRKPGARSVIARIKATRHKATLGDIDLREAIEEGRD